MSEYWEIEPIAAGWVSYDGGTIFGLVPKIVWSRFLKCDDKNLVRIPNRCLLARKGAEVVLIDSGCGGKFAPLDRAAFGLEEGDPLLRELGQRGIAPEKVSAVVMTHLHFDHAGGATCFDKSKRLGPTYPNAKYYASRDEWDDALNPIPELRAAYPQNNIAPLVESGVALAYNDADEILPGIVVRQTGGHTRGHALVELQTRDGVVSFFGDLAPSAWHSKQLWTTAYDTFALDTRFSKAKFFADALENQKTIYWAHDPINIASRVVGRKENNFQVETVLADEIGDVNRPSTKPKRNYTKTPRKGV